jgi:photosystem II stability/assembly factor-like uncharacterized protein
MFHRRMHPLTLLCLACLGLAGFARAAEEIEANKGGPPEFKYLKFRSIGPAAGGRVSRAAGVPGDPLTYYAATAAGGVWKSGDGGLSWKSVFDEQPISSIGSIAVAPSDPNVVYVGSGEANIRGNVAAGNGIYKSTDAGKTWKHVWKQEGQIGTMIVHPTNPDIAFAAVLGHAFGPNPERGVYRTTDGGKSWQKVLFKDPDTGASDVCFDPTNPKVLFAGLWQTRRRPWEMTSGGPGSGLYVSRDGGDTWTQLIAPPAPESPDAPADDPPGKKRCPGLPEGIWGKIGVAVAPSDGRRVYALIEAEKGGLFRSDNGGEKWDLVNPARSLRQRAWYYSTLTVHPTNPDVVWFPQVPMLRTIDGGKKLQVVKGMHHGDHHDLWIDPKNPQRMIGGNDGGVDITTNGGESWFAPPLPIAQFYHINVDNSTPYRVSGTMQDLGTASGPSNSLTGGGIRLSEWHTVGGGETGFTAPDPTDPNVVFAGEYGGIITRYDHRTRQARNISIYPFDPSGHGGEDLRYRFQWTAPILISPHDPKTVYHAANVLFKTTDAGLTWTPVSQDLTRNDKTKQKWSGGPITGDNTGVEVYGTIFAIAESPRQKDLLWAGTDDGLVSVSSDGGKTWTNVTNNIKGLPEWGTVSCIEPSPFDAATAYLVVDAHRLDDMRPFLFRTTDLGKTWTALTETLPNDVYLHAVREDPKKKGLLYLGTERGVAFSADGGASWQQLKMNLPTVAVHDLVVKDNDLVLGTNGRSIWIFDDLTPVREWSKALAEKEAFLFPAQAATRYRYSGGFGDPRSAGKNSPPGALFHYALAHKPKGDVTLEILDDKGSLVRRLTSKAEEEEKDDKDEEPADDEEKKKDKEPVLPAKPGLHRVAWDLTYKGATVIKKAKLDSGDAESGPLVTPGKYTVQLNVEGKSLTTILEVKLDPRQRIGPLREPAADLVRYGLLKAGELEEQLQFALKIRDDITHLSEMVNQLRSVRQQLQTRNDLLKENPEAEALVKQAKELITKLDDLENKLHNPKAKVAYDILALQGGAKLYSQLGYLFDVVKDGDGAPTQGLREVYAEQSQELQKYDAELRALFGGDLAKLNDQAKKMDVPSVWVPRAPAAKKP